MKKLILISSSLLIVTAALAQDPIVLSGRIEIVNPSNKNNSILTRECFKNMIQTKDADNDQVTVIVAQPIQSDSPGDIIIDAADPNRANTPAQTVLNGIAQSCFQAGTIVGAKTEGEKQQGIFNLIGTIFNTAAQLAGKTEKKSTTIDDSLTNLSIDFIAAASMHNNIKPSELIPCTSSLYTILNMKNESKQMGALAFILSSDVQREQYIQDLCLAIPKLLELTGATDQTAVKEKLAIIQAASNKPFHSTAK